MTEKQKLEQQLWNIANTLRGKMGADDFRDYILGFIFYKYLSEKIHLYADELLEPDGMTYGAIDVATEAGQKYLTAIQEEALESLGYFLKPSELFSERSQKEQRRDLNIFLCNMLGSLQTSWMRLLMIGKSQATVEICEL
jgi:type I restriction enzyme M protein